VKFLIECGMFQGGRAANAKNRRFLFDPREIAFVLLSHAHIDHSGLIPRLVAQGFRGAVYATSATVGAPRLAGPLQAAAAADLGRARRDAPRAFTVRRDQSKGWLARCRAELGADCRALTYVK
jgi:metallo-beta-lactamase family protein